MKSWSICTLCRTTDLLWIFCLCLRLERRCLDQVLRQAFSCPWVHSFDSIQLYRDTRRFQPSPPERDRKQIKITWIDEVDEFETVAITFILILTEFEFEENVIALHYGHYIFSKRQKVSPHRRKPENPRRTAEIKLRSSETQPTCNVCKRGGDNHLPLAGSTRSAARQVTVKSAVE